MAETRRPISLSLRFSVYERDKHTCQYCGRKPPEIVLHIDHVHPVALGGDNHIDNLLTACRDCNIGKGARDPGLSMPSRPMTWGERQAEAKADAAHWAECTFCGAPPVIRHLLWEIAAKADSDGVLVPTWWRDGRPALLNGLVAVGAIRVKHRGSGEWWIDIEHARGREDDPGPVWSLGAVGPIARAPLIAEVAF